MKHNYYLLSYSSIESFIELVLCQCETHLGWTILSYHSLYININRESLINHPPHKVVGINKPKKTTTKPTT